MPITVKDIAVIVPVYKEEPTNEEKEYYIHNGNILNRYQLILAAPDGLNTKAYSGVGNLNIEYFPSEFFTNIAGYNRLMLSQQFYKRFESYKYILICQTDALVFKDSLMEWCNRGYDYVGAPWVNKPFFLFQYVLVKMGIRYALQLLFKNNLFEAVGNGGLSLRKVSSFLEALKSDYKSGEWIANEDFYWSFFAKNKGVSLHKPTAREAALFSIEVTPKKLMRRQNNELPMGIHAWERYQPEFWVEFIEATLKNNLK